MKAVTILLLGLVHVVAGQGRDTEPTKSQAGHGASVVAEVNQKVRVDINGGGTVAATEASQQASKGDVLVKPDNNGRISETEADGNAARGYGHGSIIDMAGVGGAHGVGQAVEADETMKEAVECNKALGKTCKVSIAQKAKLYHNTPGSHRPPTPPHKRSVPPKQPPGPSRDLDTPQSWDGTEPPIINPALKAAMLADTNRDGKVDQADEEGKGTWTRQSGALFLANIADTDRRCSSKIDDSTPDTELDSCHDASDNVLRDARRLAPLRVMPHPALNATATGFISVSDEDAAANVRIFHKTGNDWAYVDANYTFSAADLRYGLELGIDGRDVRRPGVWDGRAMVQLTIIDGAAQARDSVELRVAPVLIHHHGQLAEQIFTKSGMIWNKNGILALDEAQDRFVQDLKEISHKAGVPKPLYIFGDDVTDDIWVQDFFKPGYTSIPGPDGPVFLRIMIRSAQAWRRSGRDVFQLLRSHTVGAVQYLAEGGVTDSTGNLETVPPHTHKGRSYPAGRAVMGSQDGIRPDMMDFLEAQEEQDPIEMDTSWLLVGHTDEFMQFLPADNERGWVLMADDPEEGLEVLLQAERDGHGDIRAISRGMHANFLAQGGLERVPNNTVSQVLAFDDFISAQHRCAEAIRKNIDIIKRETGITDQDIIRVPALYHNPEKSGIQKSCLDSVSTPGQDNTNSSPAAREARCLNKNDRPRSANNSPITQVHRLLP